MEKRVIAYVMQTSRYDVGNPLGWIHANIDIALSTNICPIVKRILQRIIEVNR